MSPPHTTVALRAPRCDRASIKAYRAEAGSGPTPWEAPEFDWPPYAANEDLWMNMPGGWVARVHRSLRSRLFQPVHRSAPVRAEDLESRRVTVIWFSGTRGWEKVVQTDNWSRGQVPPAYPVQGQWRGWTFFRLRESSQVGQSSSGVPRLQPDTITWEPDDSRAWNMPRQFGRSSGHGRRAQVDALGRGAVAMASMETGQVSRASTSTMGSWSVAGTAPYHTLLPTSKAPSAASGSMGSYGPPPTSTMGSSEGSGPSSPAGSSALWRDPDPRSRGHRMFPEGSQVYIRPKPPPHRWADGPTLSVREGETVTVLRSLQAPLPPPLRPERPAELPERRRERYLRSSRSDVSDGNLWDFLHGATVEGGSDNDELYDEAVESEEDTSDGSFSQVTDQPADAPEDESADM